MRASHLFIESAREIIKQIILLSLDFELGLDAVHFLRRPMFLFALHPLPIITQAYRNCYCDHAKSIESTTGLFLSFCSFLVISCCPSLLLDRTFMDGMMDEVL